MTKYEQETIVTFNAGEDDAEIYTANPYMIRKLDSYCEKYPEHYKNHNTETLNGEIISKTYIISKKLILFRKPIIMTDEQREKAKQRGKELFKKYLEKDV